MVKYEIIREEFLNTPENRFKVAKELSGAALKLYCYFETFPVGTTTYIQKDFVNEIGLDARTVSAAFNELFKNGYLKQYPPSVYFFCPECKNF